MASDVLKVSRRQNHIVLGGLHSYHEDVQPKDQLSLGALVLAEEMKVRFCRQSLGMHNDRVQKQEGPAGQARHATPDGHLLVSPGPFIIHCPTAQVGATATLHASPSCSVLAPCPLSRPTATVSASENSQDFIRRNQSALEDSMDKVNRTPTVQRLRGSVEKNRLLL